MTVGGGDGTVHTAATAVLQCSAGVSVDAAQRPATVVVHAYMSSLFCSPRLD